MSAQVRERPWALRAELRRCAQCPEPPYAPASPPPATDGMAAGPRFRESEGTRSRAFSHRMSRTFGRRGLGWVRTTALYADG